MVHIGNDWDEILAGEFKKEYYLNLREFLKSEYFSRKIYPPMNDIFNALKYTSRENTRAVILGQDPYHGYGQAHGLCFSVKEGTPHPPSLQNIFKELKTEYGIEPPKSGELVGWAKQGVLLLNTTLTVREASPQSHKGKGWEILTDRIISEIDKKDSPTVFMLWGGNARAKKSLIKNKKHLILECAHPSPLSAWNGFFGCNHFVLANKFLREHGENEINWSRINE
ncbi:MAG: uracil-DNA glycosylase [Ruminococcaceae bacterium]|nr:uracil-DNA glycosylase [Oscillospiraceae bacterium]